MATTWHEPWTEIWSTGRGRDRSYCGIAETEEGFAVDVFEGDTCVASTTFVTRQDAERAAHLMRAHYGRTVARPATPGPGRVTDYVAAIG